jgi:hypothetical protein
MFNWLQIAEVMPRVRYMVHPAVKASLKPAWKLKAI